MNKEESELLSNMRRYGTVRGEYFERHSESDELSESDEMSDRWDDIKWISPASAFVGFDGDHEEEGERNDKRHKP